MPDHPAIRPTSQLARRERRQIEAMESSAALAHRELALRREHAAAQMIATTSLAQTAAACAAGAAGFNAALRAAAPEASDAIGLIEATLAGKLVQNLDSFE
jgi:hypothetical protein